MTLLPHLINRLLCDSNYDILDQNNVNNEIPYSAPPPVYYIPTREPSTTSRPLTIPTRGPTTVRPLPIPTKGPTTARPLPKLVPAQQGKVTHKCISTTIEHA